MAKIGHLPPARSTPRLVPALSVAGMEPSTRALRLPQHFGRAGCGQFGPHSGHQSPPPWSHAGVGPPTPTSTHHTQPTFPHGAAVGGSMGPASHRFSSTRDRSMLSEANQGSPRTHWQNYLRYHHSLRETSPHPMMNHHLPYHQSTDR